MFTYITTLVKLMALTVAFVWLGVTIVESFDIPVAQPELNPVVFKHDEVNTHENYTRRVMSATHAPNTQEVSLHPVWTNAKPNYQYAVEYTYAVEVKTWVACDVYTSILHNTNLCVQTKLVPQANIRFFDNLSAAKQFEAGLWNNPAAKLAYTHIRKISV